MIFFRFLFGREVEFLRREELVQREFDGVEELARFLIGGGNAFLVRVAEVEGRNQELYKPDKFDDGEQAQRDNYPSLRNDDAFCIVVLIITMMMVMVMHPLDPCVQHQRFGNLHLDIGQVILFDKGAAAGICAGIAIEWCIGRRILALEDLDLAFGAKKDDCFLETHKTYLRARGNQVPVHILVAELHHDLYLVTYIYGVVTSFERHGLQIREHGDDLGILCSYLYRIIDEVLDIFGKIYNRIFNAVFLAAIVIHFFHVDTDGFTEFAYVFAADKSGNDLIFATHCIGPPFKILAFTLT